MNIGSSDSEVRKLMSRILAAQCPTYPTTEPRLGTAITEAIGHPGRLVRAEMVIQASSQHGLRAEVGEQLACAIEYWHQASLILDDLPCMDDAQERRGLPCVHLKHGESIAILAALALVNRAYSLVQAAYLMESAAVRATAAELVDRALGAGGILCGQAWDLTFSLGESAPREVGRIAERKTGPLLWLALCLPVLLSDKWPQERHPLRALSIYWSLAFQAMDDLVDVTATFSATGKTTGRDAVLSRPNLTLALGDLVSRQRISRLLRLADKQIRGLCSRDRTWTYLADWHERLFLARYRRLTAA
ncbi:MAG: polyprenyl synthetase family protein [Opitutaceae bacterium]